MKLVGLMPLRNEAWALGFTLRVALKWCDTVAVMLHACTDDSARIVRDLCNEFNQPEHGVRPIEESLLGLTLKFILTSVVRYLLLCAGNLERDSDDFNEVRKARRGR